MRAELEKAEMTARHNALLQGLVMSESERRKKVRSEGTRVVENFAF